MHPVRATPVAPLPPAPLGETVSISVSHDGIVDALVREAKRLDYRPNRYRILCDLAAAPRDIPLPETHEDFGWLRRLSGDRWLLVRSRCREPDDPNATIFSSTGEVKHRFVMGDAIEDVQVTRGDHIYVSYFDEGYSKPLGGAGIAMFNPAGARHIDFNRGVHPPLPDAWGPANLPAMFDCYAFHAASDREIWVHPYPELPVVRIRDGILDRTWSNPGVRGYTMFGFGDRVIFFGSHQEQTGLWLCDLTHQRTPPLRLEPRDPTDAPIKGRAIPAGRRLYFLTDTDLFRLELQTLPSSTPLCHRC